VWLVGVAAVGLYVGLVGAVRVLEQRGLKVTAAWPELAFAEEAGGPLAAAWALHYAPFFLMRRNLFVHHYLPALYFSVLLAGVCIDAATRRLPPLLAAGVAGAVVVPALSYLHLYWPLVVGDPVDAATCARVAWRASWRLICP
jgi:dolichyl-phosphate-mannose-protein mannosyltransferase